MSDLAVVSRPSSLIPTGEWLTMTRQAEYLAQSDIIPKDYRRKPANIVVAAISGRTHGWDVMTSMRNGHVIEGTWGLRPEAQLGLVRKAGHSVTGTMSAESASVTGKRCDDGTEMTVTWSIEDAKRAKLAGKQTWQNYPQMMCWWRAVGILCRVHFSDVTLGLMSVEELGADLDQDGNVVDLGHVEHTPAGPVALSQDARDRFVEACATEGLDDRAVLAAAFPDGVPDPLTEAHLPAMRDAFKAMVEERAEVEVHESPQSDPSFVNDEIAEGVVVPDDEPPPAPADVRPASRGQVGKLKGEWERLGITERDEQLVHVATIIGRRVASHNDLTTDEASTMIELLVGTEHLDGG